WIGLLNAPNATIVQPAITSAVFANVRREMLTRRNVDGGRTTAAKTSPATTAMPARGCFAGPDDVATTTSPPATPASRGRSAARAVVIGTKNAPAATATAAPRLWVATRAAMHKYTSTRASHLRWSRLTPT